MTRNVDDKALLEAIGERKHQKDIMEAFGFKSVMQLKAAYASALMSSGIVPELNNEKPKKEVSPIVRINKRGSLVIPKELVVRHAIAEGARFEVSSSQGSILLNPARPEPKTILRKRSRNS